MTPAAVGLHGGSGALSCDSDVPINRCLARHPAESCRATDVETAACAGAGVSSPTRVRPIHTKAVDSDRGQDGAEKSPHPVRKAVDPIDVVKALGNRDGAQIALRSDGSLQASEGAGEGLPIGHQEHGTCADHQKSGKSDEEQGDHAEHGWGSPSLRG